MLYQIAHFLKDKVPFLWWIVEWGNEILFRVRYGKRIQKIDNVLQGFCDTYSLRLVNDEDVEHLVQFFASQPEESYEYFRPHQFDRKSLEKLSRRESFMMFVAKDDDEIIGYCFMRSFVNKKTFKGYMVDINHRGLGVAKAMGIAMNDVAKLLGLRMFKSISPNNIASMAATKSVNDIKILKTLDNGDFLVECFPKS